MEATQYCKIHHHLFIITPITLIFLIFPFASPLSINYEQFTPNDPTLIFQGDVFYEKGFLQLTKFERDSLGRVTYYKSLHLWDKSSGKVTDFSTHFSFIINSPNRSINIGDGITFFLAPPSFPLPVPRDGSGIGLVSRTQLEDQNYTNENPFVAVEFDTISNDWDPPYDHVGIDVKSIKTAYTTQWFSIKDGRKYDAVINYNSSSFNLSVSFNGYYENNTKVEQNLYQVINMTEVLPEWVEFGFSSATGDFFEIHTLCSWSFNSSLDMEDQNNQNHSSKKGLIVGLSIGGGVLIFGIGLIWLVIVSVKRRRRSMYGFDFDPTMENEFERSTGPKRFSYKQLVKATNKFAKELKLGEGDQTLLTWEARYNIAQGLASALLYLHEEWEQCVVHRDIKASNVMLDSGFNAKLGDFGLARLVDHGKGSKTTVLAGTFGYMAPEYVTKGKASRESDVYSFGVVALEIACGRKSIEPEFNEEEASLVDWVWELHSRNGVLEAADKRLCGDFNEQEMLRLMMIGLWCANTECILRPTIRQVVQVLNFEASVPILQSPTYNAASVSSAITSSSSSFASNNTSAFGIKHTLPFSESSFTGSSQSSTSFAVISPSAALLHTY
ncbi:L-type lectin-domain containing receptor kinase IX.1-like [Senna tora]|uniref:non-specific serine/threonine protein kinase n=1 Tax=Senna tora TaxID=362788 RepID=A0A834XFJ4_9FABA|nr:L-type lectin-domain containing receptor kinase IX.1-like [Senna tora]